MHNKKTTAFLIMVTYLFSLFSPLSAYAADGAAAAQAAANALSISGQGTPGGISLTPDSGTTGMENDADTGNGNTDGTSAFPSIGDEATTEPDVTIVKEKLDEDKVATTAAIDATTAAQSPRLDPREVKGSNLRRSDPWTISLKNCNRSFARLNTEMQARSNFIRPPARCWKALVGSSSGTPNILTRR